jgi:hypothetical protein
VFLGIQKRRAVNKARRFAQLMVRIGLFFADAASWFVAAKDVVKGLRWTIGLISKCENDGVWELPPRCRFWLALQYALTTMVTPYIPAKVLRHSRLLIWSAVELIKCRIDVEVKVKPRDRNGLAFGASGHMIEKCLAASK